MPLQLYNTLTRQLETFEPIKKGKVGLYTCGPTVYNHAHIGNLRSYIFADLLKRTLEAQGYDVTWVMNITDIDDKTIKNTIAEKGAGATVEDLKKTTDFYYQAFLEDLKEVGVDPNSIKFQKVTDPDVIQEIQTFIVKLIDKGYAYTADDGSTYFNIKKYQQDFGDYGELVGKKFLQGKKIGARVTNDEYSKDELSDFALWKAYDSDDAQIYWEHPTLGKGRPGWHIECTIVNYLNFPKGTDIHTGGIDLIFPHHTNEIAQAEPIYKPFVNYWLHSEHVMVDNKKMAKSAGNFITLQNINEQGYSSLVYRYLLLQTHHRKQFNFNNKESIMAAQFGLDHLYEKAWHLSLTNTKTESSDQNIEQEFIEYLNKDLGTPQAFALVQDAITNSQISYSLLKKLDEAILGLEIEKGVDNYNQKWKKDLEEIQMPPEIKEIRTKRDQARAQKDFIKSDELRKQLEDLGYEVEDTKEGTKLHKK